MSEPPRLRNVLHPVTDVSAAIAYYSDALELSSKFIDGDRYAALDAGGVTLALVGPDEDVTGGVAAASLKVSSLTETLDKIRQHGGVILNPAHDGPHETRAVVQDPWGNVVVIYETKKAPS
ncbi:VOC family protein [Rhodococcus opacus]|uniref:VOC family protein n=1 Tax=Rhodococcus opacus TaxID=37919 RepID=UPI0029493F7C|nr:VOC family protein [Rhodococcus opacus]MDV6246319.1 VOC family protein [Rhodococcus opacus]